jgi:hypothetical protein
MLHFFGGFLLLLNLVLFKRVTSVTNELHRSRSLSEGLYDRSKVWF